MTFEETQTRKVRVCEALDRLPSLQPKSTIRGVITRCATHHDCQCGPALCITIDPCIPGVSNIMIWIYSKENKTHFKGLRPGYGMVWAGEDCPYVTVPIIVDKATQSMAAVPTKP